MDAKDNFKANLNRLLDLAELRESEFVRLYADKTATKLRPAAIREWLSGERIAYRNNLEQLTAFWRGWVPHLDGTHLFLPPDEFEAVIARGRPSEDKLKGVKLAVDPAEISEVELSRLCGSYRVFRYDFRETRIVSEALAISRRLVGNKSVLDARLWSPTTRSAPQEFEGTVIVLGGSVYMVLHDEDKVSPMMRFINLPMPAGRTDVPEYGVMAGTFDAGGSNAAMSIALERKSDNPGAALEAVRKPPAGDAAWVLGNATSAVDPAVLILLQRPIKAKAS
ncbi:MAG: hypothetical protein NW223_24115 [Hyphomicrobiaceae bacterium]|nr:hypothetical protein [Hyphomicrobiaceae bacterium]